MKAKWFEAKGKSSGYLTLGLTETITILVVEGRVVPNGKPWLRVREDLTEAGYTVTQLESLE